jgi:PPOX class probable F420-dependent enzyme
MPRPPVPPLVDQILSAANAAVVASVRPDGSPHTAATWYLWEGGRVLMSLDDSRLRLGYLRRNPAVALTVLDGESWYRHVSLLGTIEEMHPDEGLADIDRLAIRYTGERYPERDKPRTSAWMRVERWHGWDATGVIATDAALREED